MGGAWRESGHSDTTIMLALAQGRESGITPNSVWPLMALSVLLRARALCCVIPVCLRAERLHAEVPRGGLRRAIGSVRRGQH